MFKSPVQLVPACLPGSKHAAVPSLQWQKMNLHEQTRDPTLVMLYHKNDMQTVLSVLPPTNYSRLQPILERAANHPQNQFHKTAPKKVCGLPEGHYEKRCEIQGSGQEMAIHDGRLIENFNNDNSGKFVLPSPRFTMIWHQIHLNCHYTNFCY